MRAILRKLCPNCGGDISDERLELSLPCEKCLPEIEDKILKQQSFYDRLVALERALRKLRTLKGYKDLINLEKEAIKFEKFFKNVTGYRPWSAQVAWAKRVLAGRSFVALAPTGVGKSLFGIVMSLYLSCKGKRSYIILPTTLLVKQVYEKLSTFSKKIKSAKPRILVYHSSLSSKERKAMLEKIIKGDFDLLVTTSSFLVKHFEKMTNLKFNFIFVDDVDSVLKSSKNIDRILVLLGFDQTLISKTLELITLKGKIAYYLSTQKEIPEGLEKEYEEISRSIESYLSKVKPGCLVVSTATGRPRGIRVRLFKELLGFNVGSASEFLRNITDSYKIITENVETELVKLVKKLGKGGLIFVPLGVGEDYLNHLVEVLEREDIKAAYVYGKEKKGIELFQEEKVDVLIGVAMYYGLLVRGLDLPHIVRYAIFIDVPHFKFTAELKEISPTRLLQLAFSIRDALTQEEKGKIDTLVARVKRRLGLLDQARLQLLIEALREGKSLEGFLGRVQAMILELSNLLRDVMSREDVIKAIEEKTMAVMREIDGKKYFLVPDVMTYLQASGRTSRMYAGGLSKGLSVVLVKDVKLFEKLTRQTSLYSEDIEWVKYEELNIDKLLEEINAEREFIRKLLSGKIKQEEVKDLVKTVLVLVESPTKAKTIASFFGKPSRKTYYNLNVYETTTGGYLLLITASKGHILDLVTDNGYHGVLVKDESFYPIYTTIKRCLNCGEQFTVTEEGGICPKCGSKRITDKLDLIKAIREVASEVDLILLGTDPDTEGEKIAWDLELVLKPYVPKIKRIEFHEVTKRAVEKAVRNPRDVNMNLVEAQIVRRVEDRWIGFVLSQKLWKVFERHWLSAGRVQTPVLGWVIDRFNEAKRSVRPVFRIVLENGFAFRVEDARLDSLKPSELAKEIVDKGVQLEIIREELEEIKPPPPFTTDTMLREASPRLRVGVDQVMRLAQDLFETGLITYHRTDSTRVSAVGISIARKYIEEKLGKEYFVGRTWDSEGAHECIRPVRPIDAETLIALTKQGILTLVRPLSKNHVRLYDLIFKRFIASQMSPSVIKKVVVRVKGPGFEREITLNTSIEKEGFTLILKPTLREVPQPGKYEVQEVKYKKVPLVPLYSQADLIRLMKERGIGRPSTYAKIVKTLLERRYVIETKRGKLLPTKLGMKVYSYLLSNYKSLISEERTRMVEKIMDNIERGNLSYLEALKELYEEIRVIDVEK